MDETDISPREKLRGLYRVAAYRPALTAFIIGFSFFTALLEGVGISFILPIIELAQSSGAPSDSAGGYAGLFVRFYEFLGIPFVIEWLIIGVALVMVARYTASFLVSWMRVALKTHYVRHLQTEAFDGALDARV
ncbi:MAG: ABC transporter ATP-binding protein, partial [Halorubrum sp.]